MEIEFKEYLQSDQPEVLDMMNAFNAIDDYPFDMTIAAKNLDEFSKAESIGRIFLIKNGVESIGYIVLAFGFSFEYGGRDAVIDELFIKDGFRNQGIGKMSMEFIEKESNRLGIKAIHLEVEPHNNNAYHLYQKQGFRTNQRALLTKKLI